MANDSNKELFCAVVVNYVDRDSLRVPCTNTTGRVCRNDIQWNLSITDTIRAD